MGCKESKIDENTPNNIKTKDDEDSQNKISDCVELLDAQDRFHQFEIDKEKENQRKQQKMLEFVESEKNRLRLSVIKQINQVEKIDISGFIRINIVNNKCHSIFSNDVFLKYTKLELEDKHYKVQYCEHFLDSHGRFIYLYDISKELLSPPPYS